MLRVNGISAGYGGLEVLRNVSITLEQGEFVAIVGPNGAGKSTLLKSISGTVRCTSGEIYFRDENIIRLDAHKRTGLGIIQVPEGRRIFPSLTVLENLELGAFRSEARGSIQENLEAVFKLFPILQERSKQMASTFSGGEQQMLAIGRGLMARPHLLMLDEPSLGLSPKLGDMIFDAIREIQTKLKIAVLLVEQRAVEALELCDRGYILEQGRIVISSDRASLMGNPIIQKSYLGVV
jgi:branched-chain amino acid transport system ATP-binding protein